MATVFTVTKGNWNQTRSSPYVSKPVQCPNNPDFVLLNIQAKNSERSPAVDHRSIYKYNLQSNHSVCLLGNVPQEADSAFLDDINDNLFLFGEGFIGRFDLKTEMLHEVSDACITQQNYWYPCVVPNSSSQVQLWHSSDRITFDLKTRVCSKHQETTLPVQYPLVVLLHQTQQLILLGGKQERRMWICDLPDTHQISFRWKLLKNVEMPFLADRAFFYDAILGFDNVIFAFDFQSHPGDIWCLNLLEMKWTKSKHHIPLCMVMSRHRCLGRFAFKSQCSVHLLNFDNDIGCNVHACLHDLLPVSIIENHRKHYKVLVSGFIVQSERQKGIPAVPLTLHHLILHFLPL